MSRWVTDNFCERLWQCVENNSTHLTDLIFKTKWNKTALYVHLKNIDTFFVLYSISLLLNLQICHHFAAHCISHRSSNLKIIHVNTYKWETLCMQSLWFGNFKLFQFKNSHTWEKWYSYELCDSAFTEFICKTHTREISYLCDICR